MTSVSPRYRRTDSGDAAANVEEESLFCNFAKDVADESQGRMPLLLLETKYTYKSSDEKVLVSRETRPFASRMYFSNSKDREGNQLWLRTHHADNAACNTYFGDLRNIVKAVKDGSTSSASFFAVNILSTWFEMKSNEYNTYACTVASVLSNRAQGALFETKNDDCLDESLQFLVDGETHTEEHYRQLLVLVMDILVDKVSEYKFLVLDENSNIYRLAYYMLYDKEGYWKAALYCTFCFFLQMALITYVVIDNFQPPFDYHYEKMGVLAVLTVIFSTLLALPEWQNFLKNKPYGVYQGNWCPLMYYVDVMVNVIFPVIVIFAGAFLILGTDDYIDAVLNTAALLFIPEIDDQLPGLLDMDAKNIAKTHLIKRAVDQIKEKVFCERLYEEDADSFETHVVKPRYFSDMMITNTQESAGKTIRYIPYAVKCVESSRGDGEREVSFAISEFVTADCLIGKMEFRFECSEGPRDKIRYMKIWKLDGSEPFEVVNTTEKHADPSQIAREPIHTLKGVFVITHMKVLTRKIKKLRMCGVEHDDFRVACDAFRESFDYYSLWDIDGSASDLLRKGGGCSPKSSYPKWWISSSEANGTAYPEEKTALLV